MAEMQVRTQDESAAPASSDPLLALLIASCCVTTLLFVLTEQYIQATAAMSAYAVAWAFLRRA